ncbi:PA14 domain-containing protein [Actinokineospora bangkokensis]|uniref:PA14 domain-containing protein n=1 Tax=Actinokineospora bangkokensis TaxID=1193682 RepID=UPI0018E9A5A8|nr:PA14 domain-containing protein [Actinokineospora bangkokensis]
MSGIETVTPAVASADPPRSTAVDVRDLPVAPAAPPVQTRSAPAKPAADFTPLANPSTGASRFDPQRSRVVARTMFTEEYVNPDGSRTTRQSTQPLNAQDAAGAWQPVDTTLQVDAGSKRAKPKRHPLNPSLGGSADDPALVSVQAAGQTVTLGVEGAEKGRKARVTDKSVDYADVAPETDLRYEVSPGAVKETIVLKRKPAKNTWRFTLRTGALTPRLAGNAVELVDAAGTPALVMPPIETWDSGGGGTAPPATTGGTYGLERAKDGWVLSVTVDQAWLNDPARVYPVNVDPTVSLGVVASEAYRTDGYWCSNCGIRIGNSQASGDTYNRSLFKFDYSSLFGKTVVGARIDVTRNNGGGFLKAWQAYLHHATAFDFNGMGQQLAVAPVGDTGRFTDSRFTAFLKGEVDANRNTAFLMLAGTEQPGTYTYKNLAATLLVDTGNAPPMPILTAPGDYAVLTTLTPTVAVNPVTDPDGDPVTYCFTIATGSDGKSGTVVDSGCQSSPSWTIPAGVLADGVSYTWKASTYSGYTMNTNPYIGHFKVDQRIGEHGPSPVDTLGPVTVNLANGNVSTSASSPTFTTVGGTAGVTMTYNSQQPENKGVKASYFDDVSHAGLINDAIQQPVLIRNEPQINADWGTASPFAPALGADWWLVRWEGYFVPPVTGTYQFAGIHDDGPVIWVNNQKVYDNPNWTNTVNWGPATAIPLTAGQAVPIKVELQEMGGEARMKLFTRTTDDTTVPTQIVPADWLTSTDSPALPKGWTLSADLDGTGAAYTQATVAGETIVLTDATGAKHTYTKKATGGYAPPADEDGVLALDTSGRVTLTEGADVYTFRNDGKLDTQSSVQDSRKPAALQNIYTGTPSRLTQIKDPISNRAHTLYYNRPGENCYGGATPPPGADALAPVQMLCRIAYWDGTETRLWYSGGRLTRIEDPGAELTDYTYASSGVLTGVRDNLAADWVAVDPATRNNTGANTLINYVDTNALKPVAIEVTAPVSLQGAARSKRTYRYGPAARTTYIDIAGITPAIGYSTRVVFDDADRLRTTTDATGKVTSQTWNVKDQKLTTTDPAGRVSTMVYDAQDRLVDEYGPAPASCFSGQQPTAACANTVPKKHTGYDEGINGLAVAYYDNPGLANTPKVYGTGFGVADGRMTKSFDGTTAPQPGIPATNFSLRLTGEITLPVATTYGMELWVDDGARMWIDDTLVIDSWADGGARAVRGDFVNTVAGSVHRIRVDYYNSGSLGVLHVNWKRPADGVYENIPGQYLKPRHNLTTSVTESESAGVPDSTSTTGYGQNGLDPTYGLATSTVAGGVTSTYTYEAPGSGYLRKVGKAKPTGAQTTYVPYGDTATADNPCTPAVEAVNQAGMPWKTTTAAPASGAARTDEQVYDASGRVVARGTGTDWTCTTYDARDRVVTTKFPASSAAGERTVTADHAVGGDPLTRSVTDHNGTVTTQYDLMGRVVAYTDVHGLRTETTYDQVGRVSLEKVIPPNTTDSPQEMTSTYDAAGRVLTTKLGTTTLATSTYDSAGELATVTYANGSALTAIGKDAAGEVTSLTWRRSDNVTVASTVTRTRAGTVVDETLGGFDANSGANFAYDATGRLTDAWVPGQHFTYDFTSTAPSGCPTGTQANAGLNTNRVTMTRQPTGGTAVTTGYCYDAADRLIATTGANPITGFQYDAHGSTTQYTQGGATTYFGWDGADRNIAISTTGADPAAVSYTRDATDRVVRRQVSSGDTQTDTRYGHTGSGDSAEYAMAGSDKKLLTRSISLPGGVLHTWKPVAADRTFDHPTVRGDLSLTTDSTGGQVGSLRFYGPYGEPDVFAGTNDGVPDNQPGHMDYGWLGQHQRPYEHAGALSVVQMGARPYSPALGRFLTVDPVDGGSANDYDYTAADPVNTTDLDGDFIWIAPAAMACMRFCVPAAIGLWKVGRFVGRFAKAKVWPHVVKGAKEVGRFTKFVLRGAGTKGRFVTRGVGSRFKAGLLARGSKPVKPGSFGHRAQGCVSGVKAGNEHTRGQVTSPWAKLAFGAMMCLAGFFGAK